MERMPAIILLAKQSEDDIARLTDVPLVISRHLMAYIFYTAQTQLLYTCIVLTKTGFTKEVILYIHRKVKILFH